MSAMTGNDSSHSTSYEVQGCHKVAIRLPLLHRFSDDAAQLALTDTVLRQYSGIRAPMAQKINYPGYVQREKISVISISIYQALPTPAIRCNLLSVRYSTGTGDYTNLRHSRMAGLCTPK